MKTKKLSAIGLLPAMVKSIKNIMKPTVGKLLVKFVQSVNLMKKVNRLIMQNGFDKNNGINKKKSSNISSSS